MARKEDEPLERKKINLYQGDWERLSEILTTKRISPTFFIRRLVRRTLLSIEARAEAQAKPLETEADVVRDALRDSAESANNSQS